MDSITDYFDVVLAIQPWFITGFIDGDGSFHYSVYKNQRGTSYIVRMK
jgi:hypothetical protein